MTLNKNQIDTLFKFTKDQGVAYYDLQVELVDHLTSGIEEEIRNDTSLTPYDALQKVYACFGKKGFAGLVKERQSVVEKSNRKIWYQTVFSHFTLPKILLTIIVFTIAYINASYLTGVAQGYIIQGIVVCFFFFHVFIFLFKKIQPEKKLLLLQQSGLYSMLSFFMAFSISPLPSNILQENQHIQALDSPHFASWLTIVFVLEHATYQVNFKLRKKAKELYPEAFSVA